MSYFKRLETVWSGFVLLRFVKSFPIEEFVCSFPMVEFVRIADDRSASIAAQRSRRIAWHARRFVVFTKTALLASFPLGTLVF